MPTVLNTDTRVAVSIRSRAEKRGAERIGVEMPVSMQGRQGITRDISASGLSFVSDVAYEVGQHVRITIEYLLDGHSYPLDTEVEVMRVQAQDGRFIVGARLIPGLG